MADVKREKCGPLVAKSAPYRKTEPIEIRRMALDAAWLAAENHMLSLVFPTDDRPRAAAPAA
ncbi:MAG: hypothetical protein WD063_04570 [Pirellulales bacterium]